jgi:hypothetical protein
MLPPVAARANAAEVEVVDRSQEAAESIGKKVRELGAQLASAPAT